MHPDADDPFAIEGLGREAFEPAAAGLDLSGPLLEATLGRVRQRRRVRAGAGLLLACLLFAGGVLCGRMSGETAPAQTEAPSGGEEPAWSAPGIEAEMLAELAPRAQRAQRFRTAGDAYASSGGAGLMEALRCYEQSLTGSEGRELGGSGDDHWLRLALAEARDMEGGDR